MLVPYVPTQCFDIKYNDDRCVSCGQSALGTQHDGEFAGYCMKCGEKRKKFVDKIIGSVIVPKDVVELKIIEELRVSMSKERIYYLINMAYVNKSEDTPLSEDNSHYLNELYIEKSRVITELIKVISKTIDTKESLKDRRKLSLCKQYLEALTIMQEENFAFRDKIISQHTGLNLSPETN